MVQSFIMQFLEVDTLSKVPVKRYLSCWMLPRSWLFAWFINILFPTLHEIWTWWVTSQWADFNYSIPETLPLHDYGVLLTNKRTATPGNINHWTASNIGPSILSKSLKEWKALHFNKRSNVTQHVTEFKFPPSENRCISQNMCLTCSDDLSDSGVSSVWVWSLNCWCCSSILTDCCCWYIWCCCGFCVTLHKSIGRLSTSVSLSLLTAVSI